MQLAKENGTLVVAIFSGLATALPQGLDVQAKERKAFARVREVKKASVSVHVLC